MTSHNNLYKLRKLSHTLDLKSRYSTLDTDRFSQAVKLPALNSINRSVKYGDVSFTYVRQQGKLRNEPSDDINLRQSMAHSSLMTVRKRYDNVSKERENEEHLIRQLQIEKSRFQSEKQRYEHQLNGGRNKVRSMEQCLTDLRHHFQQADMQRKVMLGMVTRLKHDKIFYDQQKYNKQLDLDLIAKSKSIIYKENLSMKEQTDKIRKVYSKMLQHVEGQYQEREQHLDSMQNMVNSKVMAYESCVVKKEEQKEVAENAMTEKDKLEKNWYKVYLCQRMVEKMLRDKMGAEMRKFNLVETAYKNIKTATGVHSTQKLIHKFLNKESTYGLMLGKIAEEEKKIGLLKSQGQVLQRQYQNLRLQEENLNISRKRDEGDLSQEEKEFNNVNERSQKDYLFEETVKMWLQKNMKKLKVFGIQAPRLETENGKSEVMLQFKEYLTNLKKQVEEVEQKKEEVPQDEGTEGVQGKNVRVLVWSNKPQEDNIRVTEKDRHRELLGTHHIHNITYTVSEANLAEDNDEDYVNEVRLEMIQNNDKFMKELKKKYEQIKKQRIEADPKKRQVQVDSKPKQPKEEP